jgi:hypothetical protein
VLAALGKTENRLMSAGLFKNSFLKIERAEEILAEIEAKITLDPPYSYVLETNILTHERATLAQKNSNSLDRLVIRCGELFHNLRSAIDQAYFEAIAPNLPEEKHKAVQFPISKDAASYEQTIKSRLGDKAGNEFFEALKSLKAFHGDGGNFSLVLLHEVNVGDKHKFPTPAGNFSRINSRMLQEIIPDFPSGLTNCGMGMCKKDVVWTSRLYNPKDIGALLPPSTCIYRKTMNVPVETWFYIDSPRYQGEIIETLRTLTNEVAQSLSVLRSALKSA